MTVRNVWPHFGMVGSQSKVTGDTNFNLAASKCEGVSSGQTLEP